MHFLGLSVCHGSCNETYRLHGAFPEIDLDRSIPGSDVVNYLIAVWVTGPAVGVPSSSRFAHRTHQRRSASSGGELRRFESSSTGTVSRRVRAHSTAGGQESSGRSRRPAPCSRQVCTAKLVQLANRLLRMVGGPPKCRPANRFCGTAPPVRTVSDERPLLGRIGTFLNR